MGGVVGQGSAVDHGIELEGKPSQPRGPGLHMQLDESLERPPVRRALGSDRGPDPLGLAEAGVEMARSAKEEIRVLSGLLVSPGIDGQGSIGAAQVTLGDANRTRPPILGLGARCRGPSGRL